MAFSADDGTTRDGFFSSPRFQRDSGFGLGSIVATILLFVLSAIVIGNIVKQSKSIDPIHTSGIYKKTDSGSKQTRCIIYSDGSSDGC